jgi:hypothetical protein
MYASEQFNVIRTFLTTQAPAERLVLSVKLYYAYFLTMDELHMLYDSYQNEFRTEAALQGYTDAFAWFKKYSAYPIETFEDLFNKPRPFIWKYEDLQNEFKLIVDLLPSLWVTSDVADYSNAMKLGDEPLFAIEWLEERGFISVDGLILSRTIQPVVISEQSSEKVVLAMPNITDSEFASEFEMIPALGGGCAFKAVYGPAQLNINFADSVGIDDVDSVMLCIGKLEEKDSQWSVVERPSLDYYKIKRILSNGITVPFVN